MARDMATARVGAKVLGYGAVDVRNLKLLEGAVPKRVKDLGGIDFVM
jgi:peroxisomal 2,4-dienoyl-CoA reductase